MTITKLVRLSAAAIAATLTFSCASAAAATPPPPRGGTCPGLRIKSQDEIPALASCATISGDLTIEGTNLRSLAGLEHLRRVTGKLEISGNAELESLDGLTLKKLGALTLRDNPKLENLHALSGTRRVREVIIDGVPRLENLEGLEGIHVLHTLTVTRSGVSSLRGMGGLRRVGRLTVHGNSRLITLAGLASLESAESVHVANNQRLAGHIGFLDALRPVSGSVTVDGNASFSRHDGEEILGRLQPRREEKVAAR